MGFTEAIKTCYTKSFTCKGRAPRSEFWYFYLFQICLIIIWCVSAGIAISNTPQTTANNGEPVWFIIISTVYVIAYFITIPASFCATIRRLHDVNQSGWVLLLCLYHLEDLFSFIFFVNRVQGLTNTAKHHWKVDFMGIVTLQLLEKLKNRPLNKFLHLFQHRCHPKFPLRNILWSSTTNK